MIRRKSRCVSVVGLCATIGLSAPTGAAATDELGRLWLARSETATRHLAQPGLDACDIAIDKAFQQPRERTGEVFRTFDLTVELSGQVLQASYSYRGGNLASFELISLPSKWVARQRAKSKTLSILVAPANCALDFCTNDPFAQGPCPGDSPE